MWFFSTSDLCWTAFRKDSILSGGLLKTQSRLNRISAGVGVLNHRFAVFILRFILDQPKLFHILWPPERPFIPSLTALPWEPAPAGYTRYRFATGKPCTDLSVWLDCRLIIVHGHAIDPGDVNSKFRQSCGQDVVCSTVHGITRHLVYIWVTLRFSKLTQNCVAVTSFNSRVTCPDIFQSGLITMNICWRIYFFY